VYTHGFDWVGFGFQDFLFNNGGLSVAFIFETDWVPEREAAVFSRSQSSFPVLCLLLCTDDCMRGDGNGDVVLGMLLQGEYTEEAVQVPLRRCRRPLSRAE
jgi:hypothetical protein